MNKKYPKCQMIFWFLAIVSKKHNPPSPKIYFCHLWISPCCYNPYLRHIKAESVVTTTSPNVMACVKVAKSQKHLRKKNVNCNCNLSRIYGRLITYFGNLGFGFFVTLVAWFSVQCFPFARQDGQDEMKNKQTIT